MSLLERAKEFNRELRDALQLIFDELNQGQTKKLLKNTAIARLAEKYGITHK